MCFLSVNYWQLIALCIMCAHYLFAESTSTQKLDTQLGFKAALLESSLVFPEIPLQEPIPAILTICRCIIILGLWAIYSKQGTRFRLHSREGKNTSTWILLGREWISDPIWGNHIMSHGKSKYSLRDPICTLSNIWTEQSYRVQAEAVIVTSQINGTEQYFSSERPVGRTSANGQFWWLQVFNALHLFRIWVPGSGDKKKSLFHLSTDKVDANLCDPRQGPRSCAYKSDLQWEVWDTVYPKPKWAEDNIKGNVHKSWKRTEAQKIFPCPHWANTEQLYGIYEKKYMYNKLLISWMLRGR